MFEIKGVSQDGEWWVVLVPKEISSTGDGWIAARYTETEGDTSNVPVVEAPPLDGIEPPEPSPGTPMATALEPINIRSGPGTNFRIQFSVERGVPILDRARLREFLQ